MKMMMLRMMKMSCWLLLAGLAVTCTAATGPASCAGRCGEAFIRGQQCTCDSSCLVHNECCGDFEAACLTAQSCRGRCSESFRRGQLCECDPDCARYDTCCKDYQLHCECDAGAPTLEPRSQKSLKDKTGKKKSESNKKKSNSESEEWVTAKGSCPQSPGAGGQGAAASDLLYPLTDSSPGLTGPSAPTSPLQDVMSDVLLNLSEGRPPSNGAPDSPAPGSSLPSKSGLSLDSSGPGSPSSPLGSGGNINIKLILSHGGSPQPGTSQGPDPPASSRPRLNTLQDVAQAVVDSLVGGAPEGQGTGLSTNSDLCSDSPINGLTALSNGTILIFKGELFWSVDPGSRSVKPPQNITDALGVPSPIDAIFTRCNCQAKTYIIKGDKYWRLDRSMALEPGFPKSLASGFSGLKGPISAALPLPATKAKPETIYFFKKGDTMQKFTFPPGSNPSCGKKTKPSPYKGRLTRQAEVRLSGEINLSVSLKGFPFPVTSALSMPSPQRSDRYEHYIFSGPLFFSIKISGDLPALAKPDPSAALFTPYSFNAAPPGTKPEDPPGAMTQTNPSENQTPKPTPPPNSITIWLLCP
ncbi:proteoglycan 4a [Polymixia lowei]